jgi:hypothetical protein
MNYCLTCGRHHEESDKFCDQDGTPLVAVETVAGRSGKVSRRAIGAAALFAGAAAVCAVILVAYLYSSAGRESPPQSNQQLAIGERDAAMSRRSAGPATSTPTPAEATPTPEQSPTPSPTPTTTPPPATPESPLAVLSDSPASTSGSPGGQLVIRLDDGTSVTADDAWRARDGVWYRRGSMVSLIDPARIRSIERRQQQSPTPGP